MVSGEEGQLYAIEGFAAALIMVITAFLVVNATSVYTAGDTHINDMQLEALGTDALMMMDTPVNATEYSNGNSTLRTIIETETYNSDAFRTTFLDFVNASGTGPKHDIQFNANYTCRYSDNRTQSFSLASSRSLTGGEHSVKATRWVIVQNPKSGDCGRSDDDQAVLVEVLLWRD